MSVSKELIAAYADGELEGETLCEIEAAVAADPELQAQVAAHYRLRAMLGAHFGPVAQEPVPERFLEVLRPGPSDNVVDFAAACERTRRPAARFAWFGPALAASLVMALIGYGVSQRSGRDYAVGDVAAALDGQLVATQPRDAPVRILLSFRDGEGNFCRGFASAAQSGVACRDGRGWKLGKVIGGAKAQASEFRQAGSAETKVLAIIQDMAEGPALDAQGEEAAQRGGWRN
jgi:hypothetical protein